MTTFTRKFIPSDLRGMCAFSFLTSDPRDCSRRKEYEYDETNFQLFILSLCYYFSLNFAWMKLLLLGIGFKSRVCDANTSRVFSTWTNSTLRIRVKYFLYSVLYIWIYFTMLQCESKYLIFTSFEYEIKWGNCDCQ